MTDEWKDVAVGGLFVAIFGFITFVMGIVWHVYSTYGLIYGSGLILTCGLGVFGAGLAIDVLKNGW
jgi:hypothetical protein